MGRHVTRMPSKSHQVEGLRKFDLGTESGVFVIGEKMVAQCAGPAAGCQVNSKWRDLRLLRSSGESDCGSHDIEVGHLKEGDFSRLIRDPLPFNHTYY